MSEWRSAEVETPSGRGTVVERRDYVGGGMPHYGVVLEDGETVWLHANLVKFPRKAIRVSTEMLASPAESSPPWDGEKFVKIREMAQDVEFHASRLWANAGAVGKGFRIAEPDEGWSKGEVFSVLWGALALAEEAGTLEKVLSMYLESKEKKHEDA